MFFFAPVPQLPPNPVVQAMVDSVSADELRASVELLQGFHTRHTNSDTSSATRGIGAARNWMYSRFQAFSSLPGRWLEPGFFVFDTTICDRPGRHKNVLGTLPGEDSPPRSFVIGAHLDSRTLSACDDTSFAPGANDDASGIAVVIEMARVMSRERFGASVILAGFTGEEQGIYGSRAYAAWAKSQGMRIDGMVAHDIVGNVTGCEDPACPPGSEAITDTTSVRHYSAAPATSVHRQLARAMKLNAARYVPDFTVQLMPARDRPRRGGDHMAFDARGYAAARFTEAHEFGDGSGNNGRQHNDLDLAEFVNPSYVARIAQITLAGIANLALAPETPSPPAVETLANGSLRLSWPSLTSEIPAGYRVALRDTAADSVFYFDIREAGVDAGPVQEFLVEDVPANVPVSLSVSAYDGDHNESSFSAEVSAAPIVTGVPHDPETPVGRLQPMFPNPASRRTLVRFELTRPGHVALDVFDVEGRLLRRLISRPHDAGSGSAEWDGRDSHGREVRGGLYLIRLSVDGQPTATGKFVRLE